MQLTRCDPLIKINMNSKDYGSLYIYINRHTLIGTLYLRDNSSSSESQDTTCPSLIHISDKVTILLVIPNLIDMCGSLVKIANACFHC